MSLILISFSTPEECREVCVEFGVLPNALATYLIIDKDTKSLVTYIHNPYRYLDSRCVHEYTSDQIRHIIAAGGDVSAIWRSAVEVSGLPEEEAVPEHEHRDVPVLQGQLRDSWASIERIRDLEAQIRTDNQRTPELTDYTAASDDYYTLPSIVAPTARTFPWGGLDGDS